jgi:hypothetical protein
MDSGFHQHKEQPPLSPFFKGEFNGIPFDKGKFNGVPFDKGEFQL